MNGEERAEYGAQIIAQLAEQLTHQYGKGFSARYLRSFRKFYLIVDNFQIWKSQFPNLTWTHIFKTLRVEDATAIRWYLEMASKEMWSVEEQLRTEIERQKQLFMLQHENKKD